MSVDEIIFCGGFWNISNNKAYFYLNTSGGSSTGYNDWWTMSPAVFDPTDATYPTMFVISGALPGQIVQSAVSHGANIRPVVSLKKEVLVTGGSGTGSDPYIVSMP